MEKSEKIDKKGLVRAAQIGGANLVANDFWADVVKELDKLDEGRKVKVEKRGS